MRKLLLPLCLLVSLLTVGTAVGQTTDISSQSTSQSGSQAGAAAQSSASQGNQQNITFEGTNIPANTTHREENSSRSIDTTPDVFAPMAPSTAPCMIGMSAGVGITGFGISGGTAYKDDECNTRNTAIALHNIGQPKVAEVYLCMQDEEVAAAFAQAGIACGSGQGMSQTSNLHSGVIGWNQTARIPAYGERQVKPLPQPAAKQLMSAAQPAPPMIDNREANLLATFARIDAGG